LFLVLRADDGDSTGKYRVRRLRHERIVDDLRHNDGIKLRLV
jgi:hypothetical protein